MRTPVGSNLCVFTCKLWYYYNMYCRIFHDLGEGVCKKGGGRCQGPGNIVVQTPILFAEK